jgi:hypothetical protein
MGRPGGWMHKLTEREAMRSPGALSHRRKTERRFWEQIATGIISEKAADTGTPGKVLTLWNAPPSNGPSGSITIDSWSLSGISRRRKLRHTTTGSSHKHRERPNLNQSVSVIPRAIQYKSELSFSKKRKDGSWGLRRRVRGGWGLSLCPQRSIPATVRSRDKRKT